MSRPFIVTVASEKGGVGKTTIATNLAVYLKALHEELPVTIASFDNHFSVDQMFALGPRPPAGMAELLGAEPPEDLVALGQYGVRYVASARRLDAPPRPPAWLRSRLDELGSEGILILDTRPILDWFTEAALLAADLVLTPVKDRAALVNAAALRAVLQEVGRADRLWLVPSLVDARTRLNSDVRVSDFLVFAARERDYQVTDVSIGKSPRVEGLASGFSSRILPVLTHARQTAVHGQFRTLAEFVVGRCRDRQADAVPHAGPFSRRRPAGECPLCLGGAPQREGHRFFDLRSRRRGLLHPACLVTLLGDCEVGQLAGAGSLLLCELSGPGVLDGEADLQLHLFDAADRLVVSERIGAASDGPFRAALEGLTGREWHAAWHEWVLIACDRETPAALADPAAGAGWRARRRAVLREALGRIR